MFLTRKHQSPGYRFVSDDYDQLHIIVVRRGRLEVVLPSRTHRAGPDSVLVLRPGSRFTLHCPTTGYRGIGVVVRDDVATHRGDAQLLPATAPIQNLVSLAETELDRPRHDTTPVLGHLGHLLVRYTLRQARRLAQPEPPDTTGADWAEMVRQVIERNLTGRAPLEEVLSGLELGYRQLARHFTEHLGTSPKRYQLKRRIEQARALLEDTELSTVSVAMELGFPSSQHFAHQFGKLTGHTPTDYRKRSRKLNPTD